MMTITSITIYNTLKSLVNATELLWLESVNKELQKSMTEDVFFFSFSSIGRAFKKSKAEIRITEQSPLLKIGDAVRIFLLLSYVENSKVDFGDLFKRVKTTADNAETVSLYKGVTFFPYSEELRLSVEEGLRSNNKSIFEAITIENRFAFEHFNEITWNQMILKSLFIDSPIYSIFGFEQRKNEELTRMVIDYALERISASREVNPELWRCLTKVSEKRIFEYWERCLSDEQMKGSLAVHSIKLTLQVLPIPDIYVNLRQYKTSPSQYSWNQIGQMLQQQRKVTG